MVLQWKTTQAAFIMQNVDLNKKTPTPENRKNIDIFNLFVFVISVSFLKLKFWLTKWTGVSSRRPHPPAPAPVWRELYHSRGESGATAAGCLSALGKIGRPRETAGDHGRPREASSREQIWAPQQNLVLYQQRQGP